MAFIILILAFVFTAIVFYAVGFEEIVEFFFQAILFFIKASFFLCCVAVVVIIFLFLSAL